MRSLVDGDLTGISWDRPRLIVDVNLIVVDDGKLLLAKRHNTGFADGLYSLPAGHLELGESVLSAAIREAKEELGISVPAGGINFAEVMHNSYGLGRLSFFFEVRDWSGDVVNMEPHKCEHLRWFNLTSLPQDMVPYIKAGVLHYIAGRTLTLFGW